jgi:hypothetical protein
MRRTLTCLISSVLFPCVQASTRAQDIVVPAGTLLRCTLDEPNFSSATADIGDPVICHLNSLREFGQNVFPRGSYLGGHLEADKEPGHFVGKGYLKIEFDRIGFPTSDVPVPSKVIAAKGYRVDKKGDILGKGHATRDTVEWLLPPLWPWKILTLPARGPRPALKGESQITVRLMDDIEVPRTGAAYHSYDKPASYERPPAYYRRQSFERPLSSTQPVEHPADTGYMATNIQPAEKQASEGQVIEVPQAQPATVDRSMEPAPRLRMIALKSENVYAVTHYRINGGSLSYVLASGATGSVDVTEVDWRATSRLNAEPITVSVKSY